jgi:hypothetical protein
VAVGDICVKGTAAAVLTGVVRSTIRALALRGVIDAHRPGGEPFGEARLQAALAAAANRDAAALVAAIDAESARSRRGRHATTRRCSRCAWAESSFRAPPRAGMRRA